MKIKSINNLRWHYKTIVRGKKGLEYDSNFVGTYHRDGQKTINGFFELYHGDKPNISRFLPSVLKIAEDGQAIYEFLQNAVDCNATHFFIFYNEDYFLAINNGIPFSHKDVLSILNIANTTKEQDCNKIGRFGIGFKLVHRLVGKNDGIKELTEDYKGPIIFSWSKIDDLKQLLSFSKPFGNYVENPKGFDNDSLPWLFKILLTNFPCEPREKVKDINYNTKVLFSEEELEDAIRYLKSNFITHKENLNFDVLSQGSFFFIKLGQGKRQHLDKDYKDLTSGVQYSMNFLKRLQKVFINEDSLGKTPMKILNFEIEKGTEIFNLINPEYKECNIKISFGYTDYLKAERLRSSPNFYKYFPMGDENNGFSFIIHCDSFDNEANRRKLHESDINKNLLPNIAKLIIEKLEEFKHNNEKEFLIIYSNFLVSTIPTNQNNKWLLEAFFGDILDYIKTNIPTTEGIEGNFENVKINNLTTEVDLKKLGLEKIRWFHWKDDKNKLLLSEARKEEKLNLENWSIRDVFINADLAKLNEWAKATSDRNLDSFIKELSKEYFSEEATKRLVVAKFFKFSDGEFYSLNDAAQNENLLFISSKVSGIKTELIALGFFISELDLSRFDFYEKVVSYLRKDEDVFHLIEKRTAVQNNLTATQKKNLFKSFISPESKFTGIGDDSIKRLKLFADNSGQIKALKELVSFALQTPPWLNKFKINEKEYSDFMSKYLLEEKEIYRQLILPHWEEIIGQINKPKEFYEAVIRFYSLDETNPGLTNQRFVFVKNNNDGFAFVSPESVFFNENLIGARNYSLLQQIIYDLTGCYNPAKEVASFFIKAPFYVKNRDFCDLSIKAAAFEEGTVKALVDFCVSNRENFFEIFYLEKLDKQIHVAQKSKTIFQVTANRETRQFIEKLNLDGASLTNTFKILPYEFIDYKNEKGIIGGEALYNLLIESIEIESYLEPLIDIISYPDPKRKLLLQLAQIRLSATRQYSKDSYEFKVIDIACKELTNEIHRAQFRSKIIIETESNSIFLTAIPTSSDELIFEGGKYRLSLAQILPNEFHNSDFLDAIIRQFIGIGINEQQIKTLFAISKEPDFNLILNLIPKKIENGQQLAFIILYNKNAQPLALQEYSVETLGGNYNLNEFNFYTRRLPFLKPDAVLSEKYKAIESVFTSLPVPVNPKNKTELLKEPYFAEGKEFICPDLNEQLSDEQRLCLLEYIFFHWETNKKTIIQAIDWSKINFIETKVLLGFKPSDSIFPNEYALINEQLPNYLIEWINNEKGKINFISDFKVSTEGSFISSLRKCFKLGFEFQQSRIAREGNESQLFNTFIWLKENGLKLMSDHTLSIFKEMVTVINTKRKEAKLPELILEDKFYFEQLEAECVELDEPYYLKWKQRLKGKFSICMYRGELPKTIQLNAIDNYVFRKYYSENIAISQDNVIYINLHKKDELKKLVSGLVTEGKLMSDELLQLYQSDDEVDANKGVFITTEDMELLEKIKEIGGAEELMQLATLKEKIGDKNLAQIIEVGSQAFRNDGARFNSGYEGEKIVYEDLKRIFGDVRVKWTSAENPNVVSATNEYDFEVYDASLQNVLYFVDSKSTTTRKYQTDKTEIFWRNSEWRFIEEQSDANYIMARVFNVNSVDPEIIYLKINREDF